MSHAFISRLKTGVFPHGFYNTSLVFFSPSKPIKKEHPLRCSSITCKNYQLEAFHVSQACWTSAATFSGTFATSPIS